MISLATHCLCRFSLTATVTLAMARGRPRSDSGSETQKKKRERDRKYYERNKSKEREGEKFAVNCICVDDEWEDVGEDDEDVQEEVGSTAVADGDEGMAKRQKRNTEGRTD